ncbi:MAG: ATP-dependent helicase [Bifidobacteriaceae bacterium]|jgi:superfamily I DNA/RNA helicase|nr:ATP-dependent helicase [Bifidobacteriaceae bacterium]
MEAAATLSPGQKAALEGRVRLVEAGPGSGKTRTVVARFAQAAQGPKAAALLSFTNAAVDAARSRLASAPRLVEAPNFVGTFDQFFHRYVVTPYVCQTADCSPRYVQSWDDLPDHLSRVRPDGGGAGFPLTRFSQNQDGDRQLDESRLRRTESIAWGNLTLWTRNALNEMASEQVRVLLGAHLYDTDSAREQALAVLSDPQSSFLGRLATRFGEVIVDEFQDCDNLEHELLGMLTGAGINVVAVADPDQAIYEFRRATPTTYNQFRAKLPQDSIAALTTCYRSAPAICSLASSLRAAGTCGIDPDPGHEGGAAAVRIVVGTGAKAGDAAAAAVHAAGIGVADTRIVAHKRSDARALSRQGNVSEKGGSRMEGLLASLAVLRGTADARQRLRAIRRIEGVLLDLLGSSGRGPQTRDDQLDALGLSADQVRMVVGKLLAESGGWSDGSACRGAAVDAVKNLLALAGIDPPGRLGSSLPLREDVWKRWAPTLADAAATTDANRVACTHVHAVKGAEFDAVILALPTRAQGDTHVLDDWESGANTEQRRVLYVGASRAKKLVVLVVGPKREGQLIRILERDGVPFEMVPRA